MGMEIVCLSGANNIRINQKWGRKSPLPILSLSELEVFNSDGTQSLVLNHNTSPNQKFFLEPESKNQPYLVKTEACALPLSCCPSQICSIQ